MIQIPEFPISHLSDNVLGFVREPQGLYVSLMPGKTKAVVVMKNDSDSDNLPDKRPYVRKASGWVNSFQVDNEILKLEYNSFRTGRIEIGGLPPRVLFKIVGSAIKKNNVTLESDENGILSIKQISSGELEIFLN